MEISKQPILHSDHLCIKVLHMRIKFHRNINREGSLTCRGNIRLNHRVSTIQMHHQGRANTIQNMGAKLITDGAILPKRNLLLGNLFRREQKPVHLQ